MTQQEYPFVRRPQPEDYAATEFNGVSIQLFELFKANLLTTGQVMIEGKTFTDCTIEGPAVLAAIGGTEFDACNLSTAGDDPRSLLLMPMAKNKVVGAIAVRNCVFRRCAFFAVGYTGSDVFIDQMLQVLGGAR